jgi:hemerythrin
MLLVSSNKGRALALVIAEGRRAVAERMHALADAADERVPDCYARLVDTLERAFWAEELVMGAVGPRALRTQRENHARALSALHQAASRINAGDCALAREAMVLLGRFLQMHGREIDVALEPAPLAGRRQARCRKQARFRPRRPRAMRRA